MPSISYLDAGLQISYNADLKTSAVLHHFGLKFLVSVAMQTTWV